MVMSQYPSIYSVVVFDLHSKVKEFLDQLNSSGQIDLDQSGYPYLIKSERNGPNIVTHISRNNKVENFIINPRKRATPVLSWSANDGFVRPQKKTTMVMQQPTNGKRGERERRKVNASVFESLYRNMMED